MNDWFSEMMWTAGVEGKWVKYETETTDGCINFGSKLTYPDFTPVKQLEIIKLLLNGLSEFRGYKGLSNEYHLWFNHFNIGHKDFIQALAQLTTELMKAGELDKEKVKEILEG